MHAVGFFFQKPKVTGDRSKTEATLCQVLNDVHVFPIVPLYLLAASIWSCSRGKYDVAVTV